MKLTIIVLLAWNLLFIVGIELKSFPFPEI